MQACSIPKVRLSIENQRLCGISQHVIQPAVYCTGVLPHISLASFLWDKGKRNSLRCDTAICGVPSWAILFAYTKSIENEIKMKTHS